MKRKIKVGDVVHDQSGNYGVVRYVGPLPGERGPDNQVWSDWKLEGHYANTKDYKVFDGRLKTVGSGGTLLFTNKAKLVSQEKIREFKEKGLLPRDKRFHDEDLTWVIDRVVEELRG